MRSSTLEQDLQSYAKQRKQSVYDRLYHPLCSLIRWQCTQHHFRNTLYQLYDDIQQLCLLRIHKELKYYRKDKGMSAITFVRMMIRQELNKQMIRHGKKNNGFEEYIADKDGREYRTTYNDTVAECQDILKDHRATLPREQRSIVTALMVLLQRTDISDMTTKEKIARIAKRCHKSRNSVIKCLNSLKSIKRS